MPLPRPGFAPILSLALLGLLFASCNGDSAEPAAPGEEIVATRGQLATASRVATADLFDEPAAAMVALRSRHTASLLANGEVLAVGGTDGTAPLTGAERFNPTTGVWASAGSMAQAREQHASAVLANGQVLVTGGLGAGGALTGVEVYDPATSLWTARAPMAQARARHTITRLANGNVLVLGGTDGAAPLASGEIYDPVANTWAPAAPMHQARARHTTTLLADGRVLVVGGTDALGGPLAGVEILGVLKGTWSFGAPLATARARHTATLLADGSLLVTGGAGPAGLLATAERYAPIANQWYRAGTMAEARADHTALITSFDHVLVAGGQGASGALATSEAYEPVSPPLNSLKYPYVAPNPWLSTGSMGSARAEHSVTLLGNGEALHAGGAATASSERFSDAPGAPGSACSQGSQCGSGFCASGVCCTTACAGQCTTCDATGTCANRPDNVGCTLSVNSCQSNSLGVCQNGGCAFGGGHVWCNPQGGAPPCGASTCGGSGFGCEGYTQPNGYSTGYACDYANPMDPTPCFCLDSNTVHPRNAPKLGQTCTTSATCGADVCADGFCVPACAELPCWSPQGRISLARLEHTTTLLLNGKVLFAGGRDTFKGNNYARGSVIKHGNVFDPLTSSWSGATMNATHYGHTATLLPGGQVLVLGGMTSATVGDYDTQLIGDVAERYDAAANTWTSSGPLLFGRTSHTATLLPGGQVLVLGGDHGQPISVAELYASTTGLSALAAPMPIPRSHHTATMLADGRVLVIGGTASTEVDVYDPATDTWSLAAPLATPRGLHTATTLANGKVLVTGGELGQPGTSAAVYDPGADTWTPAASMQSARAGHGAALVGNGDVIVAGGSGGAERYDPVTDTWSAFGAMLAPNRSGGTTTLLPDGRLLVGFGLATGDKVWASVNIEMTSTLPPLIGQACSTSATCQGATCVDGVCCNTACALGGCDACSVALGATADGICTVLAGTACDDGNGCTTGDACQATGCVGSPNTGLACDDGKACTSGDTCTAGVCGGAPVLCPALDLCHYPTSCNPQTGQCPPSPAISCSYADDCNIKTCNLATGACNGPLLPLDGTPCFSISGGTCQTGTCTPSGSSSASASSSAGVGGGSASSSAGVGGGSASSSSAGVGGGTASSSSATASSTVTTGPGGAASSTTGSVASASAASGGVGGAPSATVTTSSSGGGDPSISGSGGEGCAFTVPSERTSVSHGAWLGLGLAAFAAGRRRSRRRPEIFR